MMTNPTNCLTCPEHHVSYGTYLYCRGNLLESVVASFRLKIPHRVTPPEWCPLRAGGVGDG